MASTSSETPSLSLSSSSSSIPGSNYDVFLSFRGEDTRHSFTDHLYEAFISKGIEAFRDSEKLQLGEEIAPALIQAIKTSQYAIVVFSEKYADSKWCLEELAKIVECRENKGLKVVPVFYHVDPSDVRKQTGPFEKAFDEHQKNDKIDREKIQKWKDAMTEVGNLSGKHLLNHERSEADCIKVIVKEISNKLRNTVSADTVGLVGIKTRVEKLKSHLAMESNDVRMIGIWGTGGMGKTTLARVVCGMISDKFEACCFITNVREESGKCGLHMIQQKLLRELLNHRDLEVHNVHDGVHKIKRRLHNKKILLVLDDVTELDQLNKLAGENCWFGSGSRVVITTRDKHLLVLHEVKEIYEAEVLNDEEALQLFSLKALKMDHPPEDYGKLSQAFVNYSKGLPLALEVLGSFLFRKNIDEWKNGLDRFNEFPEKRILNVLQISFVDLHPTEKEIFLDIAFFFNHMYEEILDYLRPYTKIGLKVLTDKSLVKLHKGQLWMHDLLQELGRDIVRQEYPNDPGKRSRLCLFKDIDNVLTKNTGTEAIQGIVLELHAPIAKKVYWNPEAFSKMQGLKVLKICGVQLMHDLKHLPNSLIILDWRGYPSKSLTSSSQSKSFENLKIMNLSESLKLIEVPGNIEVPNLESLVLKDCINLRRIHPSIGIHKKFTILDLEGCKNLTGLSSKFEMECLRQLNLRGCSKITKIPPSIGIHKKLTILDLEGCENLTSLPSKFEMECLTELKLRGCSKITEIPPSIGIHKKLTILHLEGCKNLTSLPSKFEMECLTTLVLRQCSKITEIPEFGRNMKRVSHLYLSGTAITTLPKSIEHLTGLVELDLNNCKSLVHLPDTIFNLKLVRDVRLSGCSKLDRLPENLGNAESLVVLQLGGTAIRELPSSIGLLKNLYYLDMGGTAIRELPSSIGLLKNLVCLYLQGCKGLSSNKLPCELLPCNSKPTSPHPMDLIFSSLSLSPASSLAELSLRGCNLKAISNDIGSLVSLELLNLSGNDFVCLPETIIRLSKLERMSLRNCTSLRSLPKLPPSMIWVAAQGCISLEMLPDPLKPSYSLEPSLYLQNCSQLVDNQSCIDWFISGIKKYLKLSPSLPLEVLKKSDSTLEKYSIKIPGSEIPGWFSHQSMGDEVEIKQPSHLYNEWMGTAAICIVFCAHWSLPPTFIDFSLIGNGKSVLIGEIHFLGGVSSDHLLLVHLTPQFFNEESHKLMREGDVNGFSQFRIKIKTRYYRYDSWLKVKKWGFRMIYKKDMEDLDRTMVQCSNSSITPYDGMDVLHHNFDNSSVAVECQKVKHSRDDYNGAGPSGEGSSKRIRRHTETNGNSDSEESSKYKDYDEELSDCEESNERNPEG